MKKSVLIFALSAMTNHLLAQTTYNVPIGQVLAAGNTGVKLPDGTKITAEKIFLGNTAGNGHAEFGEYNQYEFGGIFNGINNPNNNSHPAGAQGLTISTYNGSKDPLDFTRITSNPFYVKNGANNDYQNAIGFYLKFSKPVKMKQILLLDCDGSVNNGGNNEWLSCFAYGEQDPGNGTYPAYVPSYTLAAGTNELTIANNVTVDNGWQTYVRSKVDNSISLTTQRFVWNVNNNQNDFDPDNTDVQALADFGNNKMQHLFVLWGIKFNSGPLTNGEQQNSGMSPLVFNFSFDFGDAPDSYGTKLESDGARHELANSPKIMLGSVVSVDDAGQPGVNATGDDIGSDDGTNGQVYDLIIKNNQLTTDTNITYKYSVNYTNTTGSVGHIAAWLDWNGNGVFDASEGLTGTTPAGSTSGVYTFTWNNMTLTRSSLSVNKTYLRVRYTTDNLTAGQATGYKSDGEVEDLKINLVPSGITALPVELTAFNAVAQRNQNLLKWQVANQAHLDQYEVRRSTDGRQYTAIGKVPANTATESEYFFYDKAPVNGQNYYQLKLVEKGGAATYSKTLVVYSLDDEHKAVIYPNPASRQLNVNVTLAEDQEAHAEIYNVYGQLLVTTPLRNGTNSIDIGHLPAGSYSIKLAGVNGMSPSSVFQVVR